MKHDEEEPFYGYEIVRREQQELIEKLLNKYRSLPADNNLKQKIWDELQMEKFKGNLTIPFKIALRKNISGNFPDYIEIILDTKV